MYDYTPGPLVVHEVRVGNAEPEEWTVLGVNEHRDRLSGYRGEHLRVADVHAEYYARMFAEAPPIIEAARKMIDSAPGAARAASRIDLINALDGWERALEDTGLQHA